MNVTLRQMRAFVLVVQLGSFTRAAGAMHLTQSALSLLIQELEKEMGAQLVNRTTRTVGVTEVGAEFLPSAQRILGDLEHALSNVDKLLTKERGCVVVAAPLMLAGTLMPPILAGFRARYPSIELILKDSLPDQVLPQVRTGAADLGIGTFQKSQDDLKRTLLFKESLVAVYLRDHVWPASSKTRLKWQDLRGFPVLTLPRGSVFRDLAEAGFTASGMTLEPAYEVTYVGTLMGLVKAGLGVAIVPGYATSLADPARVAWRRLERPVIEREVLMVHRAGSTLSPAAQAFHSYVLEALDLSLTASNEH